MRDPECLGSWVLAVLHWLAAFLIAFSFSASSFFGFVAGRLACPWFVECCFAYWYPVG